MTTEMAEALLRKFTPRQLEYGYLLVTTGCTDQQIAALMGVEPHSTWHLASAWFAILAVRSRLELAVYVLHRPNLWNALMRSALPPKRVNVRR